MRMLRFLGRTWRLSSRAVMVLIVAGMLALNLATLTVSAISAVVSETLSAVGISTVAAREATKKLELKKERDAARRAARKAEQKLAVKTAREAEIKAAAATSRRMAREITEGVARRARARAIRNSASVFGESIPFLGVAVITASLALEIKDACDTAQDMRAMQAALEADGDPVLARERAERQFDCVQEFGDQVRIPTRAEIWDAIVNSPSQVWDTARASYDDLPEISFSRAYDWVIASGALLIESIDLGGDDE